jgi:hypothetical protein
MHLIPAFSRFLSPFTDPSSAPADADGSDSSFLTPEDQQLRESGKTCKSSKLGESFVMNPDSGSINLAVN